MKKLLIQCLLLCCPFILFAQQNSTNTHQLLVGTYTNTDSKGIYVYDVNFINGKATFVSNQFTKNPSFLTVAKSNQFVYAVNELNNDSSGGKVAAFSFQNGQLNFINEVSSGGNDPCYLQLDKTGKWLAVGNYSSGNFSIIPVNADGSVGQAISTTQHEGFGVNKERQENPHVHSTVFSPDNKYLLVADLGTDEIFSYSFNAKTGKLGKPNSTKITDGAGPRHIVFHPSKKMAYLVEEMFGNIDVFSYKKGKLKQVQKISMVQPKFMGEIGGADIHISPDGRFLYSSNRGDADMLTIFSIEKSGKLKVVGHQSVMGITPRNFTIDPTGNLLLVANQNSNEIVVFKRSKSSGLLLDTKIRIAVPKPVSLEWINAGILNK